MKYIITKFKQFEGAGFGHVDYMDVTNATSSGYLNDNQPFNNNTSTQISSTLPRGNWHEPSTIIVGFKHDVIKDKYFNKKKDKKKLRKNKSVKKRIKKLSDVIDNSYPIEKS
jgi:hypothetical protein